MNGRGSGGAVVADSQDSGSTWYNPAGLARARGLRFDVNVSGYGLRLGGKPRIEAGGIGRSVYGRVGDPTSGDLLETVSFDVVAHEWLVSVGISLFED